MLSRAWVSAALTAAWLHGLAASGTPIENPDSEAALRPAPVDAVDRTAAWRLVEAVDDPGLHQFLADLLAANRRLAAAAARTDQRQQQIDTIGLPDPSLMLTAFPSPPETRVGPQQWMLSAVQPLPWRGKLELERRAAQREASATAADRDLLAVRLVTEARLLWLELAFATRLEAIQQLNRAHLVQHEAVARARYASGAGQGQGVVQLQAAITSADHRLLEIEARRLSLRARLNALRDAPPDSELPTVELAPESPPPPLAAGDLRRLAVEARPDLRALDHRIAGVELRESRLELARRPDFRLGVTYTRVGERDDAPGRLQPPADNGDDILGLQIGISLPIRQRLRDAAVSEASAARRNLQRQRDALVTDLDSHITDWAEQIDIRWRQLRLLTDVLLLQAVESLDSATAGYISGKLNALDLLDAEHVLFEAQRAIARAHADYQIAIAELEGALTFPLPTQPEDRS